MTLEERKSIIRLLIEVMNKDKNNPLAKVSYLTKIKIHLALTKEDFDEALKLGSNQFIQPLKAMGEADKLQLLYWAAEIAEMSDIQNQQVTDYLIKLQAELTENKRYAKIIDKGECFSTLDYIDGINWKEPSMKNIACKSEWKKHNFYPSNGLIGEIVDSFYSEFMGVQVYVLRIDNKFFVPMSEKGISFIH